jgi:hypothetical protein
MSLHKIISCPKKKEDFMLFRSTKFHQKKIVSLKKIMLLRTPDAVDSSSFVTSPIRCSTLLS